MNIEKIKDEIKNTFSKNYQSLGKIINQTNQKKTYNFIQKDFIFKVLKQKYNDYSKVNFNSINYKINNMNNLNNKNTNNIKTININPLKKKEELILDNEIKYKIQIQEKNKIINNLVNEINYYKNGINKNIKNNNILINNISRKNIFIYSPKNKSGKNEIDLNLGNNIKKCIKFHTLDNEHRTKKYKIINSPKRNSIINILINDDNCKKEINIFKKYKNNFPEMNKKHNIQKKMNNLTHENYQYDNINISKINFQNIKLNERNNSNNNRNTFEHRNNIKLNQNFELINSTCINSASESKDNENNYIINQKLKMEDLKNKMENLIHNLFYIIESKQSKII